MLIQLGTRLTIGNCVSVVFTLRNKWTRINITSERDCLMTRSNDASIDRTHVMDMFVGMFSTFTQSSLFILNKMIQWDIIGKHQHFLIKVSIIMFIFVAEEKYCLYCFMTTMAAMPMFSKPPLLCMLMLCTPKLFTPMLCDLCFTVHQK